VARLTRKDRARQVLAWLSEHFPTKYPVEIRWVRHIPLEADDIAQGADRVQGYFGDCNRKGRRYVIRLSRRACTTIYATVDTVRHEYVHAMTYNRGDDHEHVFYCAQGRVDRAWLGGGWLESRSY
jgi:hypothetical protein